MDTVHLGGSGLEVSELVLGCMSYGDPERGTHSWTLREDEALPFFRQALDVGITTFDTANSYSDGSSEEITGAALGRLTSRDQVVICTKVFFPMADGPYGRGLSRKHLLWQIDESLRRLGTDYIDLYQIHRFDPSTPIEETMETLHDLVRSGKVRYLGASSMWLHEFARMQAAAVLHGWTPFVSMQDQYNLLQREEEREMHPFCAATGVGVLAWSPMARGRLARPWGESSRRSENDAYAEQMYGPTESADRRIVSAVVRIAEDRGVAAAQVALAWVRQQEVVTAPIIGATRAGHIDDAVAALEVVLSDAELSALTEAYTDRAPAGF